MDKETLVNTDQAVGAWVLDALSQAKIPVTLCDWFYVPQIDEWQLIIATPLYDTKGPHEAFAKVSLALQDAGVYPEVPIRRVFVRSPKDPIVRALEDEVKTKHEGTVHILEHRLPARETYSVIFAPYVGEGSAVPSVKLENKNLLRDFLQKKLHISSSAVDQALSELTRRYSSSILNVQLTRRELKKLGLS